MTQLVNDGCEGMRPGIRLEDGVKYSLYGRSGRGRVTFRCCRKDGNCMMGEGDRPYLIAIDIDKITLPNNQISVIGQCFELIKFTK